MKQNGNVLFFILIGIVLFGALTYAISQSEDNTDSNIDEERSILNSTAVINYTTDLKRAMNRMSELNGCSTEEMSFEQHPYTDTSIFGGFPNSNSPSDFSCHIFHPNGGGLTPPGGPSDLGASNIRYTGTCGVPGVGLHIVFGLGNISLDMCRKLNKLAGYNAPSFEPTQAGYSCTTRNYDGTFSTIGGIDSLSGERRGCIRGVGSYFDDIARGANEYWYYEVLYERQ